MLTYLIGDGSKELLLAYGAFPARKSDQAAFIDQLNGQFTQKPDWQAALDGVEYADNPSFEAYMPNYNEALNRSRVFYNLILTTDGLKLDEEITKFETDLQDIFDKAK